MFRVKRTNLNLAQVQNIVLPGHAPENKNPCGILAGKKLKIVLDEKPVKGPVLEYDFIDEKTLTVSEDGAKAVKCDYTARSLRQITMFTHMIPDTLRGYGVVVNRETRVVTVMEMWFIDYEGTDYVGKGLDMLKAANGEAFINREVQRQIYTGYYEAEGEAPPTERDHLANRLDNRMILWDDEMGRRQLVTYATTLFCTLVEVGTPDGPDVITCPCDVLQINEWLYVHCRGEVEYSGRIIFEVIDILANKKIGFTFGIDDDDKFEYVMYGATGQYKAQYSNYFDFNDKGFEQNPGHVKRIDMTKKGARATYRTSVMATPMNEEIFKECAANARVFAKTKEQMSSSEILPESDICTGKTCTLKFDDGTSWVYKFNSIRELEYKKADEAEFHKEDCRIFFLDDNLVCIGHYCHGVFPPSSHILFLDFDNGCTTLIDSSIGGKYELRDVTPIYRFGYFECEGVTVHRLERHGFTRELLGRSFTWTYSEQMTSQHIYNAPRSYSWTILNNTTPGDPMNRAGGYVWSSPCDYIKLRKDVYIMNWVEENWEGLMACAAMNLRLMHDCGFSFGIGMDGKSVTFDVMGAICRNAGSADLSDVFEL